jgi:hypothetical protein
MNEGINKMWDKYNGNSDLKYWLENCLISDYVFLDYILHKFVFEGEKIIMFLSRFIYLLYYSFLQILFK